MKKGPLSKKEKKTIEQKYKDESVANIAISLDRSTHMVEKHIMKLNFSNADADSSEDVQGEDSNKGSGGGMPRQDITHLLAKKEDRGVVIMTREASMAADDNKSKKPKSKQPSRMSRFIHRIKE